MLAKYQKVREARRAAPVCARAAARTFRRQLRARLWRAPRARAPLAAPPPARHAAAPPLRRACLQIEKPVGEGTYGVVYKARDKVRARAANRGPQAPTPRRRRRLLRARHPLPILRTLQSTGEHVALKKIRLEGDDEGVPSTACVRRVRAPRGALLAPASAGTGARHFCSPPRSCSPRHLQAARDFAAEGAGAPERRAAQGCRAPGRQAVPRL
jgi:serine/threonine protein kinase